MSGRAPAIRPDPPDSARPLPVPSRPPGVHRGSPVPYGRGGGCGTGAGAEPGQPAQATRRSRVPGARSRAGEAFPSRRRRSRAGPPVPGRAAVRRADRSAGWGPGSRGAPARRRLRAVPRRAPGPRRPPRLEDLGAGTRPPTAVSPTGVPGLTASRPARRGRTTLSPAGPLPRAASRAAGSRSGSGRRRWRTASSSARRHSGVGTGSPVPGLLQFLQGPRSGRRAPRRPHLVLCGEQRGGPDPGRVPARVGFLVRLGGPVAQPRVAGGARREPRAAAAAAPWGDIPYASASSSYRRITGAPAPPAAEPPAGRS